MRRRQGIAAGMAVLSAVVFTACTGAGTSAAETDTTGAEAAAGGAYAEAADGPAVVYFTSDLSPEGLMKVYEQLNGTPQDKAAVKLSTDEPPASNYLAPELIKDLVQSADGTIVECNTAYDGSRAETAMHRQAAA